MTQLFDDEFMGPLVGALAGTSTVDPLDDFQSTMNVWEDKRWLLSGRGNPEKDPLARIVRAGGLVTRGADPADPNSSDPNSSMPLGRFDLSSWESSVENARIPAGQLDTVGNTNFLMEPHAAAAMWAMIQAAKADGVQLSIGNTYRDYATQAQAYAHDTSPQTPTAAPGTSNHGWGLAADFQITAENHAWLVKNAARFGYTNPFGTSFNATENWHWEYGQGGSTPDYTSDQPGVVTGSPRSPRARSAQGTPDLTSVPLGLADGSPTEGFLGGLSHAVTDLLMPEKLPGTRRTFTGSRGAIEKQIYAAFMDAGRPDLAKMVGTPAFTAWVGAESGWNPGATSPPNNNGLANDGLFQIWRGHAFNSNGQVADMSPYQQALLVTENFHLTPQDILGYYAAIQSNSYHGWG